MKNTVIYKYTINPVGKQSIYMPKGAEILCVQSQQDSACIWASVNTDNEVIERRFLVYGTGQQFIDVTQLYIGTFQMANGSLVFHLFEIIAELPKT